MHLLEWINTCSTLKNIYSGASTQIFDFVHLWRKTKNNCLKNMGTTTLYLKISTKSTKGNTDERTTEQAILNKHKKRMFLEGNLC